MKIKKTLFSTEIEVTPQDLADLRFKTPAPMSRGFMTWIYKEFGLNLWSKPTAKEDESSTNTK